jgi:CHAT domain-containing protein
MEPIQQHIPPGKRIYVIPDGPLVRLNLETLPVAGASPHYWIDDAEVAVAPALSILTEEPSDQPFGPRPTLLLMGDPNYAGTTYPPLAAAGEEIRNIQHHFPQAEPAVFAGARATPAAYFDARPAGFSIIHFAAHAETADDPLNSAVILSPQENRRRLTARDVIACPLSSRLVTISGCRSAGDRTYAGEGMIGLAWAFLHAGARSVVAGLWDINDTSTARLMDRFYLGIAQGDAVAVALRKAKLDVAKDPQYKKPYYWAAFQVYTRGVTKSHN